MPKEKFVWTTNMEHEEYLGHKTYRSETAHETLVEALNHITVWNNMKTIQGYEINIENDDMRNDETTFVARRENRDNIELEKMILRKVTLIEHKKEES